MRNEIHFGRIKYISFIVIDLICLVIANILATKIYLDQNVLNYGYDQYRSVILIMLIIDVIVTLGFNTLRRVLRRRKRSEIRQSIKHVGLSFVILAVVLFSTRQGAQYSRVTVYLAYIIDFFMICGAHILWKTLLKSFEKKGKAETALLMSTDRFAKDGIFELRKSGKDLRYLFLLKNINVSNIGDIPVLQSVEEVSSVICWEWIDKVYIYGVDQQMIPGKLIRACRDMDLKIDFVDFNYKVIDVKTIVNEDPKYGALSFLEGKRDIPFPIRRVYWITETEANLHRGFHAHKLNCQLLFCPYGVIDIILDDGKNKTTVRLDEPGKGLLLMPGLWREMVWQKSGSVLCVLASEYYDAKEYIRNYDEFISYNREYDSDVLEVTQQIERIQEN